ncbi:MAG TPA: hypothetical protein PKA27_11085 [Fimbriimonadaceae bacterium]|nr:hypothetical protein [Fimbriimonadaceae bacterium]
MEEHAAQPGPDLNREQLAERLKALEEEAARLKASLEPPPEPEPTEEPEETDVPDSEVVNDLAGAERALSAAHLAKMRGNKPEAEKMLTEAMRLAPKSAPVLAAVGEDFAERGQIKKALEAYRQAKEVDPTNAKIEGRYAELVLKDSESMLFMSGSSAVESLASAKSAVLLSVLVPGVGQIVTGETGKGIILLVGWLASWITAFLIPNGLKSLVQVAGGGASSLNMAVLIPVFAGVCFHLVAIFDASTKAKTRERMMRKTDRPVPPANLPFE